MSFNFDDPSTWPIADSGDGQAFDWNDTSTWGGAGNTIAHNATNFDWGSAASDPSFLDTLGKYTGTILGNVGNYLTTPGGLLTAGGALATLLDNKPKPTQISYLYPEATQDLNKAVAGSAGNLLGTPTVAYGGPLTVATPGAWGSAATNYDYASGNAGAATAGVPQTDMSQYINPYAKAALDPVAAMMKEDYANQLNTISAQSGMHNAFGAGRSALAEDLTKGRQERAIGDLYATGLGKAYDSATAQFNVDQARRLAAAQSLNQTAAGQTTLGAGQAQLEQFNVKTPYEEFTRQQAQPIAKLGAATSALSATEGMKPTQVTLPPSTNVTQAVTGLVGAGYGLNKALGLQEGGQVPGPTLGADYQPAVLDGGEHVIPADVARTLGPKFFQALVDQVRASQSRGTFDDGGMVHASYPMDAKPGTLGDFIQRAGSSFSPTPRLSRGYYRPSPHVVPINPAPAPTLGI